MDLDTQKEGSLSWLQHAKFDSSGSWKMLPAAINQLVQGGRDLCFQVERVSSNSKTLFISSLFHNIQTIILSLFLSISSLISQRKQERGILK
jgi:hypothetical protein